MSGMLAKALARVVASRYASKASQDHWDEPLLHPKTVVLSNRVVFNHYAHSQVVRQEDLPIICHIRRICDRSRPTRCAGQMRCPERPRRHLYLILLLRHNIPPLMFHRYLSQKYRDLLQVPTLHYRLGLRTEPLPSHRNGQNNPTNGKHSIK